PIGDEYFLTGEPIMLAPALVKSRDGAGPQCAEVRSRLRLGQVHRPGPFAGNELGEVALLLLFRTMRFEKLDRADREQRAQPKAHAARVPPRGPGWGEREGQPLAAIFGIGGKPVPAALDIAGIDLAKPRRGAHDTVFEGAAGVVGRLVERREFGLGELCRL